MAVMSALAYAKINTGLKVGEKREDGFHGIATVFRLIDLCDCIDVLYQEGMPFSVMVSGLEGICAPGKSTIEKAARLWHGATGIEAGIIVSIKKNSPVGAGLGGGSSDAAEFLKMLKAFSKDRLSVQKLKEIALEVGSDVPFFMSGFHCAAAIGRGEILAPMESSKMKGFIVVPDSAVKSTASAFAELDSRSCVAQLPSLEEIKNGILGFSNDFEAVNSRPDIVLKKGESLFLTGSGSCWVLLTDRSAGDIDLRGFSLVPFDAVL